jgi:citronellyl-CoA dehydrogenase
MLFTEEHEQIRRTIHNFIVNEINPHVDEWEDAGEFPIHDLFKKMGDLGLLGITKPTEYGGLGLDFSYEIVFSEELGVINCSGVPMSIGVQTSMATPALAKYGSEELKSEFLVPTIAGDIVASIAVSEPGAGSDVAGIKTTARKDGDDYVINGNKMWITNSPCTDFYCLLVNTSDDNPHRNKSLIIVPADLPGISVGEKLKKMGCRSSETASVFFDDVRVPQRYLIGEEGRGFGYQMEQFQEERIFGGVGALKRLEYCIQETIDYTRERKAFGVPLLDKQVVHFRLAELQTEVEALRSMVYRATEAYMAGEEVSKLASMCKLKAGRLSREVTDSCLQFWGGMGFMEDTSVNRCYRDMRLGSIGGGADEVMLDIICKLMKIHPGKR